MEKSDNQPLSDQSLIAVIDSICNEFAPESSMYSPSTVKIRWKAVLQNDNDFHQANGSSFNIQSPEEPFRMHSSGKGLLFARKHDLKNVLENFLKDVTGENIPHINDDGQLV
jgi:hypothetical protein